jgi:rhodanese-related sulfurtransferase
MNPQVVREITVQELKQWIDSGAENYQLIDVREASELAEAQIGGLHIPVGTIIARSNELSKDKKTAILCRSGRRSEMAVYQLQQLGFTNLFNVAGGIIAYAQAIDKSLKVS